MRVADVPTKIGLPVGRKKRAVAISNGDHVSDPETPETTTGGALGKVVGKAKEMVGKAIGEDDLAREGRLQQAQGEAEAVAQRHSAQAKLSEVEQRVEAEKRENALERERLQTEIASSEREKELDRERQRAEQETDRRARESAAAIEQNRRAEESVAAATERRAAADRAADEQDVARLEREARLADARADLVDPEVN